jgi:hypothetical protein
MDTPTLIKSLRKLIKERTEELNKLTNALAMLVPTHHTVIQPTVPVKRRGRPRKNVTPSDR